MFLNLSDKEGMPAKPPVKRVLSKGGAPTKRNDAIIERMLKVARTGLPMKFVATAGGISRETLNEWRNSDAGLNQKIEEARLAAVEARWETIRQAAEQGAPNSWMAASWMLERTNPSEFCTPAVALGVQVNQTNVVNNNSLTISMEVGEKLQARSKAIDAQLEKETAPFLARRERANGTGRDQVAEIEGELMPPTTSVALPPPISRSPNWWASLSRGDGHREVSPEAAEFILRTIAVDTLGGAKAAGLKLDMDTGTLTLHDVWGVIQELCGPAGWQSLTRRGER